MFATPIQSENVQELLNWASSFDSPYKPFK